MDYTQLTLGMLLSSEEEVIRRNAQSILKQLQRNKSAVPQQESFQITSVAREDLEGVGYDTRKVKDDVMRHLADKMGEAYTEQNFWIDLPIIADWLKIPKKKD